MTVLSCAVEKCESTIEVDGPVSGKALFICKNHPRSVQVQAAGRVYDERRDEADKEIHFQTVQFDPELARSRNPLSGINHENDDRSDITRE